MPVHDLKKTAIIRISVVNDVLLKCPNMRDPADFIYNSRNLRAPMIAICDTLSVPGFTSVLLRNPMIEEYTHENRKDVIAGNYAPSKVLQVWFPRSRNPLSARDIHGIQIQTFDSKMRLIDTYTDDKSLVYSVKAKPIFLASVTPLSDETFTACPFQFTFTLANKLEMDGFMELVLPPEIELKDDKVPLLIPGKNMDPKLSSIQKAEQVAGSFGRKTLSIYNFISADMEEINIGETMNFTLDALVTPLSTVTTSSFKVYTRDYKGRLVNYMETDLFLTVKSGKFIS